MKRFYRHAAAQPLEGGFTVALDDRPIRTPAKAPLLLPTPALAEAIADEWRTQGETIKPLEMGLTRLANTAIDRVRQERAKAVEDVARYGTSELLCYRADKPADLVARQAAVWQPWLDWVGARYGAHFRTGTGVVHVAQPPETMAALRVAVAQASDFELAALGSAVQALGSLVLGLALWRGALDADAAADAALLDELYQAAKWGEDREAAQGRVALRRDVVEAQRFITLLQAGG
jgi:chaperone required for assembly of F1-ATPase